MKKGDKVRIFKRSELTGNWQELPYKGVIKSISYNRDNHPIFCNVMVKEDDNLYSEELLSVDSPKCKLKVC